MIKEVLINDDYRVVDIFDNMKVGDIYKVPYDESRYNSIRLEAVRRNKYARLEKKLKSRMDIMYRVSKIEYPGFIAVIRLK